MYIVKLERLSLYRSQYCHINRTNNNLILRSLFLLILLNTGSRLSPQSKPLCRSLTFYLQPSALHPPESPQTWTRGVKDQSSSDQMTTCWSRSHSCVRASSTWLFCSLLFALVIIIHPFRIASADVYYHLLFCLLVSPTLLLCRLYASFTSFHSQKNWGRICISCILTTPEYFPFCTEQISVFVFQVNVFFGSKISLKSHNSSVTA